MRIQARLFLGTAILVLALMLAQWWLHARQLEAVEQQLSLVATSVSKGLLTGEHHFVMERFLNVAQPHGEHEQNIVWVNGEAVKPDIELKGSEVHVVVDTEITEDGCGNEVKRIVRRFDLGDGDESNVFVDEFAVMAATSPDTKSTLTVIGENLDRLDEPFENLPDGAHRFKIEVKEGEEHEERMLIIRADSGIESKIPIPISPAVNAVTSAHRQGMLISGGLLGVGLLASAFMARRVARPLQDLARSAEAVGGGDLGAQVQVNGGGEVGELQRAFNLMSLELARLEHEKSVWRQREHLAQLGDLSRGLAHTLRNPLNTLGLAVEELADQNSGQHMIVTTARGQIARIDRWLRSFLALGAGDAAEAKVCDLNLLLQDAVLEAVQQGSQIKLEVCESELPVEVVETALGAALANLVENGRDVTPDGESLDVSLTRDGNDAIVTISDRGPGLPLEVRERLFSPHVTTKVGGSGMGLFLAKQLIVEMHGGRLALEDREGGGTTAEIRLSMHDESVHS